MASGLFAQVPDAFKYQAVVRDPAGNLITNQDVSFRMSILQNSEKGNVAYSEMHKSRTNEFGLVTLEIGNGTRLEGDFAEIDWSAGSFYIKTDIDVKGGRDFTEMGTSKLLSVPYALSAKNGFSGDYKDLKNKPENVSEFKNDIGYLTLKSLLGDPNERGTTTPYPNLYWGISGNYYTDPLVHNLGTNDSIPLIITTNKQMRMRIEADGNILTTKSMKVGKGFIGNDEVWLNFQNGNTSIFGGLTVVNPKPTLLNGPLTVNGITNLNNSFFVNNMSPSYLTGTLTVDKATNLNSLLNVNNMSPTYLSGTLTVDKATNLNNLLNVNNASPTVLTGTLRVDQNATFKQRVTLDNVSLGSSSTSTGALVVAGGVGIGQNLYVGGTANFGGAATFGGVVNITDATQSTAVNNGALVVAGGAGIGKNLNLGGDFNINTNKFNVNAATGNTLIAGTLGVTGATTLSSTLGVAGATTLNSTLGVTGATNLNSTLTVAGTSTLNGATTINNSLAANGQVTISTNVGGGSDSYGAYPLRVQGSDQGIAIKLNAGTPNNDNNFVTFFNGSGAAVGAIEGETLTEKKNSPEYIFEEALVIAEEVKCGVAIGLSFIPTCVGGLIVSCGVSGSSIAMAAADLVLASANLAKFYIFEDSNIGVSYSSGSADYAEYLERANHSEKIYPGEIVGVTAGKVSKITTNARQFMVISTKPAVLGNMPAETESHLYEKVAFMGQIPVKVQGLVKAGDYILPSGNNDGIGIAVSPEEIKPAQYKQIVGVSWSTSYLVNGVNLVNMAIGLNSNDVADLAVKQDKKIADLENRFKALEDRILGVEKGQTKAAGLANGNDTPGANQPVADKPKTREDVYYEEMPEELDDQVMEEALIYIENQYKANNISIKNHAGLYKLLYDPVFKAEVIQKAKENYKIARAQYYELQKGKG